MQLARILLAHLGSYIKRGLPFPRVCSITSIWYHARYAISTVRICAGLLTIIKGFHLSTKIMTCPVVSSLVSSGVSHSGVRSTILQSYSGEDLRACHARLPDITCVFL